MTPVVSIVGAGGLLGSAMSAHCRGKGDPLLTFTGLPWEDSKSCADLIRTRHADVLETMPQSRLLVFWCAGTGRVGSTAASLEGETALLERLVEDLGRSDHADRTVLCVASSAGGIWSGLHVQYLDEHTPPNPWHAYGETKLRQEELVLAEGGHHGLSVLVARISNLYGLPPPGKPLTGLVNNMVANALRRRPTPIYVPVDTSRDYVTATAAAGLMHREAGRLMRQAAGVQRIQIVASGHSHTIGYVVDTLGRVMGRPVPVSLGYSPSAAKQPRTLAFRSVHLDLAAQSQHLAHELQTLTRSFMTGTQP